MKAKGILCAAVLGSLVVAGCSDRKKPREGEAVRPSTAGRDPVLACELRSERQVYKKGEKITLTVALVNRSDGPVQICAVVCGGVLSVSPGGYFSLSVRTNGEETPFYRIAPGDAPWYEWVELPAGGERSWSFPFKTKDRTDFPAVGEYTLVFRYSFPERSQWDRFEKRPPDMSEAAFEHYVRSNWRRPDERAGVPAWTGMVESEPLVLSIED